MVRATGVRLMAEEWIESANYLIHHTCRVCVSIVITILYVNWNWRMNGHFSAISVQFPRPEEA